MPRLKRTAEEAQLDLPKEPELPLESREMLTSLRNMWEFASLMQYIYLFGSVVKIDDDFDIEDLEAECLKPSPSERLAQIGLQLLKYVSSHRGLTPEIFDEYARRQYVAKAPQRNPFGEDEDPIKFNDMDIYTRIQILQQLSTWTLGNADRIRGLMPQDDDHLDWRMEPLGWDKEDRSYYVLDDNRLYRRSDVPVPPPSPKPKAKTKPKAKSKSSIASRSRATRASKRRKIDDSDEEVAEDSTEAEKVEVEDTTMVDGDLAHQDEEPGYGFTSKTWECVAITLDEYQDFMASIFRSRDPNEKALRARIEEDVLPVIEKRAEALRQKQLKKIRELQNVQKMATAKRSSRLADKAEKDKNEREEKEAEEKRQAELRMAHEEQERQRRIEEGHESRRFTREQRVREREAKRILHEEELARLEEDGEREESRGPDSDAGDVKRASERQRKTQRDQHKKELERLAEDESNWYFDCSVCGKHGENMDDGTHSIACDRCNVWQHSKCHGFSPKQAESDSFNFVCATCKRREEDAKKPKIPPLKLTGRSSSSPKQEKSDTRPPTASKEHDRNLLPEHVTRQLDSLSSRQSIRPSPGPFGQITNGTSLSPPVQDPAGHRYPPVRNFAPHPQQTMPPDRYAQANGHQQQHYHAHQGAVASAGGHHVYNQQHQYASAPSYTMGHYGQHNPYQAAGQNGAYPPPQYSPAQQQGLQYPPGHYAQQGQRPGSTHSTNGPQSPVKAVSKAPSASPPVHQNQTLPPPTPERHALHSPVKQSPQYPQQMPHPHGHPSPHPPHLSPIINGRPSLHHTPQMQCIPASYSNAVASDGMSGPWPEGSQTIPQKHDQSPAQPPPPSQSASKIFPPGTPLVPSHQQNNATGPESIPVKKLPDSSPGR